MFRLTAWLVRKAFEKSPDQQLSLEEKIKQLEEKLQPEVAKSKDSQEEITKQVIEPTDCFETTGTITQVKADYFIIDGIYFVPKALLKNTESFKYVEENKKIQFLANRKTDPVSGETFTKVIKILSIIDGIWNDENTSVAAAEESDWTQPTSAAASTVTYFKTNRRREPGTVIGKENDILTVETDAGDPVSVNIDKTSMSFVPALGDYVTLDCEVQMDGKFVDFKGEVLEVIAVEPSRVVTGVGVIIVLEDEGGEIRTTTNGTVMFMMDMINDYRPAKGDRVEFRAVENKHVRLRCIKLKLLAAGVTKTLDNCSTSTVPAAPFPTNDGTKVRNSANERNNLWQDKHGICITGDFNVTLTDGQGTELRKVVIKNVSDRQHKILRMLPPKGETPQVCLKSPYVHTQSYLFPGESVEYEFEITGGGLLGRNEESCVWCFGGSFRIGRQFRITVGEEPANGANLSVGNGARYNGKSSYCKKQLALLNMRRAPGPVLNGRKIGMRANFIANPMPTYNLPDNLVELVLENSRARVLDELERPPHGLSEELSAKNYAHIKKTLIFLEEIKLQMEFRNHDIARTHFTPEDSFLALEVANVAETRPSILVGDCVRATAPWSNDNTIYQGVIHRVLHSRVLLKFDQTFHSRYNGESYAVQFTFGRGSFRKLHHAIKRMQLTHGLEYLFPERIHMQEPLVNVRLNASNELVLAETTTEKEEVGKGQVVPWYNPMLNRYQKQAIVNVLRGVARPMPHIIFGPPGTGKTVTIVELIHQLVANVPSARLIVATPSNSAAYLITERLAGGGVLQPGDFIRLVSMSQVEREMIPEHLVQYCATVDVAEERSTLGNVLVTESGLRMKYQANHIGRHRVTISTCLGIGALMQMHFDSNHFTHVIIDEAGQALEPEALIPICLVSRTVGSVTLVGDPKQLGPIVHFNDDQCWSHRISLLERLLNRRLYTVDRQRFTGDTAGYDARLVTMLRINYRSIPSILSVYNDMFYDGALEPHQREPAEKDVQLIRAVRDILQPKQQSSSGGHQEAADPCNGFFFCGIDGTNKQSPDSPSWFNPTEASMVYKIVERLYRGGNCRPDDIGIITPYVMQARSIRRIFDVASIEPPKIGSVEEFQGQERRVIIISTVRSSSAFVAHDTANKIGFISAPKRINVALSRAKVALVVVGNPKLLATDKTWMRVLQRAVEGGTYSGCSLGTAILKAVTKPIQREGSNLQRQYDDDDEYQY